MVCTLSGDGLGALCEGWRFGIGCGTIASLIVILLVLSAPAYHPAVPRALPRWVRRVAQWLLRLAPLALFGVWAWGASIVGWGELADYVLAFGFGALVTLGPIVLLFMVTVAGRVGRAGAR
jgi:Na+/H+-dicarboxylate symporter